MQQREKAQRDENVVKDGKDRRCPVNPLESKSNIYQHACQSIEGNENSLGAELAANLGADDFHVSNGEGAEHVAACQSVEHRRVDAIHFRKIIEIGEHAVGFFVAIVQQLLGKLRVAVTGID